MEEYNYNDSNYSDSLEFFSQPISIMSHAVYIDEEIREASYYRSLCETLRCASENDHFTLYIISLGGDLDGAIAISSAIEDTRAHVHGVLTGTGASAASMIFLACHTHEISHRSRLMIHEPSYLSGGKHSENKTAIASDDKWFAEIYKGWYGEFLTEEEMDIVLNVGKDVYFHYDELAKRLPELAEKRASKQKEQQESIDEVIDELNENIDLGVSTNGD